MWKNWPFAAGCRGCWSSVSRSGGVGQRLSQANLLTSLLFAAAHTGVTGHWSGALVFVPSLAFGYFHDQYQRVMPAVLLHSFYNAGFFAPQGG
ncbi:MAG: CPBP family intramembrane metalloprotease [Gammaproteobacteria bacterium]|nr:CPBP family intramembrane metalloprotease [Gammaproteobacteria bacterium]